MREIAVNSLYTPESLEAFHFADGVVAKVLTEPANGGNNLSEDFRFRACAAYRVYVTEDVVEAALLERSVEQIVNAIGIIAASQQIGKKMRQEDAVIEAPQGNVDEDGTPLN